MPLPIPNLDDRTFEQLVTEGRSLIPRYSKEWTNHNPSDPGITLLELFAYLTEAAIFQLNQVPDSSIENFLRLLAICREGLAGTREPIDQTIARALEALEEGQRAITAAEFEALARQAVLPEHPAVARAKYVRLVDELCVHSDPHPGEPPAVNTIIVIPDDRASDRPMPSQALMDHLFQYLKDHSLLATRIHVIGPEYVEVRVNTSVVRRPGSGLTAPQLQETIQRFLHPLMGGQGGTGWPFGRWVYRSEIFQLLEGLPQVDHVVSLELRPDSPNGIARAEGIEIPSSALIYAPRANIIVTVEDVR